VSVITRRQTWAFSGANGSAVGPGQLEQWYSDRIQAEGRWRSYARVQGDSGHSCSSALHAEALGGTSGDVGVYRYLFGYTPTKLVPGATHGGDEQWLFNDHKGSSAAERRLSEAMALWWGSLATTGDPNAAGDPRALWDWYLVNKW